MSNILVESVLKSSMIETSKILAAYIANECDNRGACIVSAQDLKKASKTSDEWLKNSLDVLVGLNVIELHNGFDKSMQISFTESFLNNNGCSSIIEKRIAVSTDACTDVKVSRKKLNSKSNLVDDDFIESLKASSVYNHLNIDDEIERAKFWLQSPKGRGRKLTRQFFLNWINRKEKPMAVSDKKERKVWL